MIDPMNRVRVSHLPDPHQQMHSGRPLPELRIDTQHLDGSMSTAIGQLNVPAAGQTGGGSNMVCFLLEFFKIGPSGKFNWTCFLMSFISCLEAYKHRYIIRY